MPHDRSGHNQRIGEEGAEKPHGAKLERVAKTVMSAAPDGDFLTISIVQEEVLAELRRRGIAGETPVFRRICSGVRKSTGIGSSGSIGGASRSAPAGPIEKTKWQTVDRLGEVGLNLG